ncbi:hypothetical protein BH11PSE12_BH11PSE12_27260 [soil metagenome]
MKNSFRKVTLGYVIFFVVILAACQKSADTPEKKTALPSLNAASNSVARPELVPPPDASMAPEVPAAATAAQQASTKGAMSKEQESSAMPMPGQANDHSPTTIDKKK